MSQIEASKRWQIQVNYLLQSKTRFLYDMTVNYLKMEILSFQSLTHPFCLSSLKCWVRGSAFSADGFSYLLCKYATYLNSIRQYYYLIWKNQKTGVVNCDEFSPNPSREFQNGTIIKILFKGLGRKFKQSDILGTLYASFKVFQSKIRLCWSLYIYNL